MSKPNRRYLRPMKLGRRSQEFYVFDTETGKQFKDGSGRINYFLSARPEHMIFGVVYGDNFTKVIHSVAEFKKEFLKKRYKNKIVYAHNAEYDLSALYGNIYMMDPSAIFNGKFITASNGNCKFADSFNLMPTSVQKLGELIGISKKKLGGNVDKDGNILSSVDNLHNDISYCVDDCKIVYESLKKLFADSEPSFTIGSLSLKKFKSEFLKSTIKVNGLSDQFFDCLYGGRTEAFRIGEVDAFCYDLNSAYPWAKTNQRFPDPARLRMEKNKDWQYFLNSECAELGGCYFQYEGMIEATVIIPDYIKIPSLPFRTKDSLIFPIGEFRGAWTFSELRYAINCSDARIKQVHKLIVAESIESPFVEYVDHFWKLRSATNDEFERYYYKLYMNNLYGKLIQRERENFRFCETTKDAIDFMQNNKIKHVELIEVNGGYFLRYDTDKIFDHTICCWGAYITAFVRNALHSKIIEHADTIVYCDTDSIFSEREEKLDSKELGGWKREKKKITQIRALKDYVYVEDGEEKQMLKGVKRGSKQLDAHANVFKIKRMIKTRESFRRIDNLPPGTFIEHIKVLTGDYKKRTVLKGGTTKPFKLSI